MEWTPSSFVIIRKDAEQLKAALKQFGLKDNHLLCNVIGASGPFLELEAKSVDNPALVGRVLVHCGDVVCQYSNPSNTRPGFAQ